MIIFKNKGLIDVRSITTFGVSSKENESAIGYFGTGLKYAIAILLREGCEITIHIGKEVLKFGTKEHRIRVNDFTIVNMNGQDLSFTTELGKNWKLWQAFRELYCNCTDENGSVYFTEETHPYCESDETMICVSGKKFETIFDNKHEFILESKPLIKSKNVNIHDGISKNIFYKGIAVHELPQKSMFTYNLQGTVDLTEDRSLKYVGYYIEKIVEDISLLTDAVILNKILRAEDSYFENDFTFKTKPSEIFTKVCLEAARNFDTSINRSAIELCNEWALEAFSANSGYQLNNIEQKMLEKSIRFCDVIGYNVNEYPIKFSENLGKDILGRAHKNTIYISKRVFMQGTKQVAATILEEYLHLKYGLVDETYKMQTFLFDVIAGLGERIMEEPL